MGSGQTIFVFRGAIDGCDWQLLNDGVMGGLSSSSFQISPGGGAVFSGNVSLDNGGGFASVRSPPLEQDFSSRDSFRLRICGDGHRYKFNVRTESGSNTPTYQCAFETQAGEWEECRLPFAVFVPTFRGRALRGVPALDAARVRSIGFLIADKQNGPFRLKIDWVKAS
jgi:NADH dehydrogenase [ubiquinone] 1 alpha subcomplex assembly factor 1